MNTFTKLLFLAFIGFSISACAKNGRLKIKLVLADAETGEPIQDAAVDLKYIDGLVGNGSVTIKMNYMFIGRTDSKGRLEKKIGHRRLHNDKSLIIYPGEGYIDPETADKPLHIIEYPLEGKEFNRVIFLPYYYSFRIKVQNMNCSDETDSVYVTLNDDNNTIDFGERFHTGCQSYTFLKGSQQYTWKLRNSQPVFHVRSVKNGVVTEFDHPATLQRDYMTTILIQY